MEETFVTRGIVLFREHWRETDARIVFYARDAGKLELVARGAAKPLSKLSGHLEPYNLAEVMIVKGRRFDYIGAAKSVACQPGLKTDLSKLACAGEAFSFFNRAVETGSGEGQYFDLLGSFLSALERERDGGSRLWLGVFYLKFMALSGYRPEFDRCVSCGKASPVAASCYFDARQGGILCAACRKEGAAAVPSLAAAFMRLALDAPWTRLAPSREVRNSSAIIGRLTRGLIDYHVRY